MGCWPRRGAITWIGVWRGDVVSGMVDMGFPPQKEWFAKIRDATVIRLAKAI
jgi:hypothetical protein